MTDNFSLLDGFLVGLAAVVAIAMLQPGLRDAPFWRATVTPLASIIGSGFLIVAPLLASIAGGFAVAAIITIVLLSFWLGSALRFTIRHEREAGTSPAAQRIERLSDLALALAYVISITFYIRLMCGFVLTGVGAYTPFNADTLATLVLGFIGLYGWRRGLLALERLEEYSVTIKLAIIVSLLFGLAHFDMTNGYDRSAVPASGIGLWDAIRQLAGMLLIVQGFETSKYLGASYAPALRMRSMRVAQVVAGLIYVTFVALAMPLMAPFARIAPSETAIIDMAGQVAVILPLMLVVAATMSQFSAAIADTIGAGGVLEQETRKRLTARVSYLVITALAIALVWLSNIFEIVALASRAFAFYYMLQAVQAANLSLAMAEDGRRKWRVISYAALALLLLAIVLFASPAAA